MLVDELSDQSAVTSGSATGDFLKEFGKSLRGKTIRILTEDTPPSAAASRLVQKEFTELTGIEIEWISEPLSLRSTRCDDLGLERRVKVLCSG